MTTLAAASTALVVATLAVFAFGPDALARARSFRSRRRPPAPPPAPAWDPGRELRAERRARELMRSIVPPAVHQAYLELGYVVVEAGRESGPGYGYLLYPYRPIIAFDPAGGEPLSEYCVSFEDREAAPGARLPAADDVLAKWIAIRTRERELIGVANMHLPGRQVDPGQVRRDLLRFRHWDAARAREAAA